MSHFSLLQKYSDFETSWRTVNLSEFSDQSFKKSPNLESCAWVTPSIPNATVPSIARGF